MGWGSSTRRGGGRKVRALPRKSVFLGFGMEEPGMSQEFAGTSRTLGAFKKLVQKKVHVYVSALNYRKLYSIKFLGEFSLL